MSYLQVPRLHFSGSFQADPSTVNNDPEHFNTAHFKTSYDLPGNGATNGWWNPAGTGSWRLFGCTVNKVTYLDGTTCDDPLLDPIVGTVVNDADTRVAGKIVDLDPEQQMVSQLWGFQVVISNKMSQVGFKGDFGVAAFGDIWVRYPGGQPDSFFGAYYQSVLTLKEWKNGENQSRYLTELEQAAGREPQQLSIKFNVDGFDDTSDSPNFTFGRIVGSIGIQQEQEPRHFIAGRVLNAAKSTFNTAYAVCSNNILYVDFGNSFSTTSVGGTLANQGQLYIAVLPANGKPDILKEIDYQLPGWYESSSGIVAIPLTDAQITLVENNPLAVVASSINQVIPTAPLLQENAQGTYVQADEFVFRMNPGDKKITKFYATVFGKPYANQSISLAYDPSVMQGQATQGPIPGPQLVGQPQTAFTFPLTITTDANGCAELPMLAGDPGNPRVYIDGQLYGITYQLGTTPPPVGSVQNGNQIISAIVFSGFEVPEEPNWIEHIQPIFQRYADLYPVMRPIVDLSNYANVVDKKYILGNVFNMDIANPNYMPVTRDLSEAKRQTIRKWLAAETPAYMDIDSVDDLKTALQIAIELEHSTIPPYLCALYSIKPNVNTEVSGLIRSVVMEEMLHMTLMCNLLIAIGGEPNISHNRFVPRYPGSLPGGLRSGLTVRLRRCSIQQIRECFMSIEEPEELIEIKRAQLKMASTQLLQVSPVNTYTIGWFYDEIKKALEKLQATGELSFGNADKQVQQWRNTTINPILTLDNALAAIDEIKEQGEGTQKSPDDNDKELAHYYKFAEIAEGRHLIEKDGHYSYSGAPITFDPAGVWPMMDDPMQTLYPAGSRAQILSKQFSEVYKALLKGLHRTFNGEPEYLPEAIGSMFSLETIAQQLMRVPSGLNDGTTAGPSFEV